MGMENIFWTNVISVLAAFIGSACFAVIYNAWGGNILCSALGGAIGWLVYLLTGPILQSDIAQTFAGTIALAVFCEVIARVRKAPVTGFLIVSIFPLVPGASIYYTMLHAINGENDLFLTSFIHTIGVAGAIAVGSLLVASIVRMTPWYHAPRAQSLPTPQKEVRP